MSDMAATIDPADRPLGRISPRQIVVLVVASAVMVAGLVVIAPALADLPDVWSKLTTGHLGWLLFALVLEVALVRRARDPVPRRLDRR